MPGWLRKPLRKPECPGGLVDTPHPLPWPSSSGPALTPEAYSFPRPEAQTTQPGPGDRPYLGPGRVVTSSCPRWTGLGWNPLTA